MKTQWIIIVSGGLLAAAAWAAANGYGEALAALSWMAGIVFLAIAVDNTGTRSMLQAATGLLLPVLAWLCMKFAPEFGLISALAISAWALAAKRQRATAE